MIAEGPSRKEREKEEHRSLIITAALHLFAERGYHNVSMQEIAGKAEFSVGTLYKFFANKEDLYITLLREKAAAFFGGILDILIQDGSPVEIVKQYVRASSFFISDNHALIRLYLADSRGFGKGRKAQEDIGIRQLEIDSQKQLAKVIERGIQEGTFREVQPWEAAIALTGILEAFFVSWLEDPDSNPRGLDSEVILDLFLQGISKS